MIATLPVNIVQFGARTASSAAVISQAHPNVKVAIIERASRDSLRHRIALIHHPRAHRVTPARLDLDQNVPAVLITQDLVRTKNLPATE